MPFDPNASDLTIGVVGTGSMGRGIMQVAAQGGMRVVAYDEKPGAAQAAKDYIAKMLGGQVEKGRLPQSDADAALARITVARRPRRGRQGQPDHRSHHRAPRCQAGPVRQARGA